MNDTSSKTILIIQTAFIGDTILASHFARAVKDFYPNSKIHFFLRKGNESVIQGLSSIEKTWIWDKKGGKTKNLINLISELRKIDFDIVFNLHRHFNSGLVTSLMKSPLKVGFSQNPLSVFYTHKVQHLIPHESNGNTWHEVQRNLQLLKAIEPSFEIKEDSKVYKPELPIEAKHIEKITPYEKEKYFVVAPASVWFTKAWSKHKYQELVKELSLKGKVYLIGGPDDKVLCDEVMDSSSNVENLCGKLNLLDSAALMKNAKRVFVNDSAPLHLASSVNAKTTAIFCSTVPAFGYTPLADDSVIVDVGASLNCRPCGLHGHKDCPLGHFNCSEHIEVNRVLLTVK
jgi:ADP-heptose:LPS heptosyltransferase